MMANELDALEAENQRLIKLEGALRRSCETLKVIAHDKEDGLVAENTELQRKFDSLMESSFRQQVELDESKEGILHETLDVEYVVCMTEEKWAEVKGENKQLKFGMAHATAVISKQADSISELIAENERLHEALTEINNGLKSEHTH